jgi:hypothetical protein
MQSLFVFGCYRSGTSLLRLMLNAHSKISIPEETRFIPFLGKDIKDSQSVLSGAEAQRMAQYIHRYLSRNQRWVNTPTAQEILDHCNGKYSFYNIVRSVCTYPWIKPELRYWGDKTPIYSLHGLLLDRLFPDSKFIYIIRDVRDVAASIRKLPLRGALSMVSIGGDWSRVLCMAQATGKVVGPERFLEIHYEDLVVDPAGILRKICTFLQLEFEESMLKYYLQEEAKRLSRQRHHVNVVKPVNNKTVGNYRKVIKPKHIKVIEKICGPILLSYGYNLENPLGDFLKKREYIWGELKTLVMLWFWLIYISIPIFSEDTKKLIGRRIRKD